MHGILLSCLIAALAFGSPDSPTGAEAVCKQMGGKFTPPSFCIVPDGWVYQFGGTVKIPDDWMCANPSYDQDPHFGSCLNPKTGKFDFNYCAMTGLPKKGCNLVPNPTKKQDAPK
jgi:hypothetical protein